MRIRVKTEESFGETRKVDRERKKTKMLMRMDGYSLREMFFSPERNESSRNVHQDVHEKRKKEERVMVIVAMVEKTNK